MAIDLARLKRAKGNRRRVVRIRPIKADLRDRRALEAVALEMVKFTYGWAEELLATVPDPGATEPGHLTDAAPEDIDRIINLIITQTSAVMARLQLKIRGVVVAAEKHHRKKWKEGVLAATGVDLETALDPTPGNTVGASVTRSANLIRDIGDEGRKRIGDIVMRGVTRRIPPRELVSEIIEAEAMSRRRALNIAADQMTKLHAALDRARQEEAGVTHFTWRHSGKVHAREDHLARDGEVYEWENNDIDPGDMPGEPPFCGCVAQATLIDDDRSGDSPDDLDELELEDG